MPFQIPNIKVGSSISGSYGEDTIADLQKALTAGYGTDVSQLTGGAALRVQSLERTLLSTVQENKHFRLFNKLLKPKVGATVDEWTERSGVGGFLGGSTNSETGVIRGATGKLQRRVGTVKYLMTRREVSFVASIQEAISNAEAVEQMNGSLQLLSDAEYLAFEGDASVVGTEFDGIYASLVDGVKTGAISDDHVIDMRGAPLNNIAPLTKGAQVIAGYGNFGTPTDLFMPQMVQADLDTKLDPAYRVSLTSVGSGGLELGAPVVGIRTSWGDVATQNDVFVREGLMHQPFQIEFPAEAAANTYQPSAVAVAAVDSNASSQFAAAQAGSYYYLVTGVNSAGQSVGVTTAQVAIKAGGGATLTITRSASAGESGYVIYRSRMNGLSSIVGSIAGEGSDFREMIRIPCAGASTTYTDLNADIPGTVKAYMLNLAPSAMALTWRKMLPMLRFNLYPTVSATIPWAQMMFGYLRIGKRQHHVVYKNILPSSSLWNPFPTA